MTGKRVLIVDDKAQVRQDLRTVLDLESQARGESIDIIGEAANGGEALRKVETLHPDVVLMDLAMPEMDGWTASQKIKERFPSILIIALTIHGDPESRQKAFLMSIDRFIEKGVPAIEIFQAIVGTVNL